MINSNVMVLEDTLQSVLCSLSAQCLWASSHGIWRMFSVVNKQRMQGHVGQNRRIGLEFGENYSVMRTKQETIFVYSSRTINTFKRFLHVLIVSPLKYAQSFHDSSDLNAWNILHFLRFYFPHHSPLLICFHNLPGRKIINFSEILFWKVTVMFGQRYPFPGQPPGIWTCED